MTSRGSTRLSLVRRLLLVYAAGAVLLLGGLALVLALTASESSVGPVIAYVALGLSAGVGLVYWPTRRLSVQLRSLTDQAIALSRESTDESVHRSQVEEVDDLAMAITTVVDEGRARLSEAGRASATLEVVLDVMPQGTVLFNEADEVVYANPSARDLLGPVPATLSGLAPFGFQTLVRDARSSRAPVSRIVEHGKPVRHLRGIATPFHQDERVLLVIADVTERERAASVRRDFVANASHELKTPVSAIIASSEALQMSLERGDGSSQRFARQIESSSRQLDRLVTDLLDLSRLERDEPELSPLSLDHLVREEVERIRPVAEERGIALSIEVEPVQMAGSRRDVAIAVRNLLDNAIRYTDSGGSIGASLAAVGNDAVLQVSDTGEGIPTRDLSRVFERFYRVDNARSRSTGGTGLGLAIVKHVVESHGGRVEAESELGVGSTFTVHLPLLEEKAAAAPLA